MTPPVQAPPVVQDETRTRPWVPLVLAGAFIAVVVGFVVFGLGSGDSNPTAGTSATTVAAPVATVATATTTQATAPPTTTPSATTPPTTEPPVVVEQSTTTPSPVPALTIGHWVAFPPFQQRDDDGLLTGFDVDVLNMMIFMVGATPNWVETDNADMLAGTTTGRYDIAAGRIRVGTYTDMDFTIPYFNTQVGLIVDPGAVRGVTSFADLGAGDPVGVAQGSQAAGWARTNLEPLGIRVIAFDGASAAFSAQESGEVRAVVSALFFPSVSAGLYAPFAVIDAIPAGDTVAFGVDPANEELRTALDAALMTMIDDGTYREIYDRWFSVASASVAP